MVSTQVVGFTVQARPGATYVSYSVATVVSEYLCILPNSLTNQACPAGGSRPGVHGWHPGNTGWLVARTGWTPHVSSNRNQILSIDDSTVLYLSNPWPRPGLAVLFI